MSAVPPPSEPEQRPEQVRVRRSAKILNFLLTGAFLGAVAALIATFAFPSNDQYPTGQVFGFLLLIGITLGAAVGGIIAVIVDRSLQRRTRDVMAVREVTLAPEDPELLEEPEIAEELRRQEQRARDEGDGDPSAPSGPARP